MNMLHTFTVEVSGCTREQAEQVMAERINHDEDYGFPYSIRVVSDGDSDDGEVPIHARHDGWPDPRRKP